MIADIINVNKTFQYDLSSKVGSHSFIENNVVIKYDKNMKKEITKMMDIDKNLEIMIGTHLKVNIITLVCGCV